MSATIALDHIWSPAITGWLRADVQQRGLKEVARDCKAPPDTVKKWAAGQTEPRASAVGEYLTSPRTSHVRKEFYRLLLAQTPQARDELIAILRERKCGSR